MVTLPLQRLDAKIFSVDQAASCLDSAWELLGRGVLRTWDSVLCRTQSAGKGRMGRTWHSPPGNIYAAWLCPEPDREWQPLVSLVLGYVLGRALWELGAVVSLKWPNDIWLSGGKVGGILVEERQGIYMAGVGINVLSPPPLDQLSDLSLKKVSCLASTLPGWPIAELWATLVYRGSSWYEHLRATCTLDDFVKKYEEMMLFRGQYMCIRTDKGDVCGSVRGISRRGEIRIQTAKGMFSFFSGSLTVPEGCCNC